MTLARRLLATGLAVGAAAGIGAAATTPEAGWYADLDLPPWQPPPLAFPLVWTPLYADLAVVSALGLERMSEPERRAYVRALAANLVLNAGWSVLFWRVRRPWLSTAWCALLVGSSADLARRLRHTDPRLGAALAAYPTWCTFATALNAEIARRNA
jgi:tryptophan-rich sensory protein